MRAAARHMAAVVGEGNVTLVDYETVRANLLAKELRLLSLEGSLAEQQAALSMAMGDWR